LHLSREKKVPAYVIFTDATLVALAEQMPTDEESLMEIPGIGPSKIDQYGEAVLSVLEAGYPVDEG
jgi:DNA helicase-2/ATP-dependent DNA helicase PcrA